MAFNQILTMLSQHPSLEDELHIYPLTSLHHLHKVFPNLPEIKKLRYAVNKMTADSLAPRQIERCTESGSFEERLCNDDGNEIISGTLPNPSETARLEITTNK